MNQKIFNLNLSINSTSLYLLIEALSDLGTTLNYNFILSYWNASKHELNEAFAELVAHRVLGADEKEDWFIYPTLEWR